MNEILSLTAAQKRALRSQAHGLSPVVMIGDQGLTEAVVKEADNALLAHSLIKIRVFSDEKTTREAYAQILCQRLNAALVQHIGKLLVLYRPENSAAVFATPMDDFAAQLAGQSGKGLGVRQVTIVKQESPHQRPRAKKVLLKGNERVTKGGSIKRAKKRTTSPKKNMK